MKKRTCVLPFVKYIRPVDEYVDHGLPDGWFEALQDYSCNGLFVCLPCTQYQVWSHTACDGDVDDAFKRRGNVHAGLIGQQKIDNLIGYIPDWPAI